MLNVATDEKISNYGRIQSERNARGAVRPYDPAERHYGPSNVPPRPRRPRGYVEKLELFDGPIPERWTEQYVGRRLVDAFRVLNRLPGIPWPKDPGNAMPDVKRDADDLRDWPKDDAFEALARRLELPDRAEITRMEGALAWIAALRTHDTGMALQVMHWANQSARRRSIRRMCIEQRWSPSVFYRRVHRGREWISGWLNSANLPCC